jgi:hypothetical protein
MVVDLEIEGILAATENVPNSMRKVLRVHFNDGV